MGSWFDSNMAHQIVIAGFRPVPPAKSKDLVGGTGRDLALEKLAFQVRAIPAWPTRIYTTYGTQKVT